MLPPDRYEHACRLFCRILHRLEERDRRNEQQKEDCTIHKDRENSHTFMEGRAIDRSSMPGLPTREHSRAEEERICGDAAR